MEVMIEELPIPIPHRVCPVCRVSAVDVSPSRCNAKWNTIIEARVRVIIFTGRCNAAK